jgi:hypothetical protein
VAPAGSGQAAAFASGDTATYSRNLEAVLLEIARPPATPGYALAIVAQGDRLTIEALAPSPTALTVLLQEPRAAAVRRALPEVAPRRYRLSIRAPRAPLVATLLGESASGPPLATAVHAPPRPLEHAPGVPDEALLRALASTTGGTYIRTAAAMPPPRVPTGGALRSLVPALSLLAALLFLLDLAAEVLLTRGGTRLR